MKLLFDESDVPGVYCCAGRRSWTLELTPDRRFRFVQRVPWGLVPADTYGTWALERDIVVLHPEGSDESGWHPVLDVPFIPVSWGHLQLLVPEHGMPAFCADARGDSPPSVERTRGTAFCKRLPSGLHVDQEAPIVPERFRAFYEHGPIHAEVVRINGDGTITMNKGSAERLQPEMILVTRTKFREDIELQVVAVREHEAIARPYYLTYNTRWVKVGDSFTSGEGGHRVAWPTERRLPEPPPTSRIQTGR